MRKFELLRTEVCIYINIKSLINYKLSFQIEEKNNAYETLKNEFAAFKCSHGNDSNQIAFLQGKLRESDQKLELSERKLKELTNRIFEEEAKVRLDF